MKVEGKTPTFGVVGEENAVEVIILVQEDAGGEVAEVACFFTPLFVKRSYFYFLGSPDRSVEVGDRETTFQKRVICAWTKCCCVALVDYFWIKVDLSAVIDTSGKATQKDANLGER